jgi:DNA-binding transcriptional LysR family regulator
VAVVPAATIKQEVANQTLAAVKLEDGDFNRPIAIVYKKSRVLSPAMKKFVAMFKENA